VARLLNISDVKTIYIYILIMCLLPYINSKQSAWCLLCSHIYVCGSTICFNIMWGKAQFSEKLLNTKCVFFYFVYNLLRKRFSFEEELSDCFKNNVFVHLYYPLFFSDDSKTLIFPQFLEKVCDIKYFDNHIPRPVVRCGWKDVQMDGNMNSH